MKEIWRNMKELWRKWRNYEGYMKKYWRNYAEIWRIYEGNMKELCRIYEEISRKYEEICGKYENKDSPSRQTKLFQENRLYFDLNYWRQNPVELLRPISTSFLLDLDLISTSILKKRRLRKNFQPDFVVEIWSKIREKYFCDGFYWKSTSKSGQNLVDQLCFWILHWKLTSKLVQFWVKIVSLV